MKLSKEGGGEVKGVVKSCLVAVGGGDRDCSSRCQGVNVVQEGGQSRRVELKTKFLIAALLRHFKCFSDAITLNILIH